MRGAGERAHSVRGVAAGSARGGRGMKVLNSLSAKSSRVIGITQTCRVSFAERACAVSPGAERGRGGAGRGSLLDEYKNAPGRGGPSP
eukprot:932858-Prymnesium_polylepis.2